VLLSLADEIANLAESVASYIVLTRPQIPGFMEEGLNKIVSATLDTFQPLEEILKEFQKGSDNLLQLARSVGDMEQKVDRLQWELTKSVFKSDLPLAEKLLLKEFIDKIAAISDQIEDVSDRFEIMLVKRPI